MRMEPRRRLADAFPNLWRANEAILFRKCLRWMSGHRDAADEALSRARVQAFEKFAIYGDDLRQPERWLSRLTYHVCMDLHREIKRERTEELPDASGMDGPGLASLVAGIENPERICLRHELESFLLSRIQALPTKLRAVMELLLFEEKSYPEISSRLAISGVALRKRIQEARSRIRDDLTRYRSGRVEPGLLKKAEVAAPPLSARIEQGHAWSRSHAKSVWFIQVNAPGGLQRDETLLLTHLPKRPSERRLAGLKRYVEEHPSGWKKRLEIARLLRLRGELRKAIPHYCFVVKKQPARLEFWIELVEIYVMLDRDAEAHRALATARDAAPREASKGHLEGVGAMLRRDWTAAEHALRYALELEPANLGHWIALGRMFLRAGQPSKAAATFDQALRIDPESSVLLTLSHDACLAMDRRISAFARVGRAWQADPTNLMALGRLLEARATARLVRGEQGRVSRHQLARLQQGADELARASRCAAVLRLAAGQWGQAQTLTAEFTRTHPRNAMGWLHHAEILQRIGDRAKAIRSLEAALRLDPGSRQVRLGLCRILGPFDAAKEPQLIVETVKRFPEDCEVLRAAAMAMRHPSLMRRALQWAERSVRLEPELPEAHFCTGRVLSRWGRARPAAAAYEKGWALLPPGDGFFQSCQAAIDLGDCWRREGQPETSRHWLQTAIEHADSLRSQAPAEACFLRAQALEALGSHEAALESLRAALDAWLWHPMRASAVRARRRLLSRRARP